MVNAMKYILNYVKVSGEFILDNKRYKNKFNRNMGIVVDGLIKRSDVTGYRDDGSTATIRTGSGSLLYDAISYTGTDRYHGTNIYIGLGNANTTPTVTDNRLQTELFKVPAEIKIIEESSTSTSLKLGAMYDAHVDVIIREAGVHLYLIGGGIFLLSRALVTPEIQVPAFSRRVDAYKWVFPAQITRSFVNALFCSFSGYYTLSVQGLRIRDINGVNYVLRTGNVFAGSPDLRIGTDNTPSSPDDYYLKSYLATLGNQSQSVEVDTTLQQIRVVRTGTYTPSTTTTLGEIALLTNVFDRGGTSRTIMVARATWDPPVQLQAGTTYTIGIVLLFQ